MRDAPLPDRILHVPRRFVSHDWRGTETVLASLASEQLRQSWRPEVHTSLALSSVSVDEWNGIPVRRYRYCYPFIGLSDAQKLQLDKKGGNLLSLSLFLALVRASKTRIFHAHALKRLGGEVFTAARLRKRPFVVTLHGGIFDVPASEVDQMIEAQKGKFEWGKLFGALFRSRKILENADAVILEAWSAGKPVVVSRVGGLKDLVSEKGHKVDEDYSKGVVESHYWLLLGETGYPGFWAYILFIVVTSWWYFRGMWYWRGTLPGVLFGGLFVAFVLTSAQQLRAGANSDKEYVNVANSLRSSRPDDNLETRAALTMRRYRWLLIGIVGPLAALIYYLFWPSPLYVVIHNDADRPFSRIVVMLGQQSSEYSALAAEESISLGFNRVQKATDLTLYVQSNPPVTWSAPMLADPDVAQIILRVEKSNSVTYTAEPTWRSRLEQFMNR
jgi:hypothetical protein